MEILFVLLIVFLAIVVLIRKLFKQIKTGDCGCGCGCKSCSTKCGSYNKNLK